MRSLRGCTKSSLSISLVFRIVAVKPNNLAVAFKGKHMSRDPIEKPTIMRDHDRAPCEVLQRFFERAPCVHIQVVGRFVEQQNVRAFFQHLREMDTIALAAFLLLSKTRDRNHAYKVFLRSLNLLDRQA